MAGAGRGEDRRSPGKIARDQLERAKAGSPRQSFMRLAGSVRGPRELSSRKGVRAFVRGIADSGFLVAFANRSDPRHSVLTVDRAAFRVYRRNKRDTIPLICPPAL